MTNLERMRRTGCEKCQYTGTIELPNHLFDICTCVMETNLKEKGLDEDNYMELFGIKKDA